MLAGNCACTAITEALHSRDWGTILLKTCGEVDALRCWRRYETSKGMREYLVAPRAVMEHPRALWPQMRIAQELAMTGTAAALTVPEILRRTVQGWLAILGPVTAGDLASALGVGSDQVFQAMLQMEMAGTALRGIFERDAVDCKAWTGEATPGRACAVV